MAAVVQLGPAMCIALSVVLEVHKYGTGTRFFELRIPREDSYCVTPTPHQALLPDK